ncbi:hypothetical protein HHI36_003672 [Cryptolaemus montrouzieri]|uniref:C2HC/C3H-type domain-containing protein n=1 Tax=Cryptolaemus montrouzieri TaxID=559131 RepID=A0ABD2PEW5_9CUCU
MQEKEEKLLRLYEKQQQRAFDRVGRGSAGSNTSIGSTGGGKVRQLFEERRQRAGVDKSYPLEPLNGKINGKSITSSNNRSSNSKQPLTTNTRQKVQATVQRSVTHIRNGKPRRGISPLEGDDEDVYVVGKLSNVGGVLPSQNGYNIKAIPDKSRETQQIRQSPVKPISKKSPVKSQVLSQRSSPSSQTASRSGSSTNSSPQHSTIKMATTAKQNVPPNRSPNNTKPSSKQTAPRAVMSAVVRDDLQECSYCGRRFATDRVHKHEDVCSKTNKKQRKAYDAFKHRVQGTELEQFAVGGRKKGAKFIPKKPPAIPIGQSKKNWRRTHEEFIATIRSAKMAQAHIASGGKLSDLPPPPPSSNPDYVQCPSCGRRFNEAAAQRHIPKCASYEFNKPKAAAKRR